MRTTPGCCCWRISGLLPSWIGGVVTRALKSWPGSFPTIGFPYAILLLNLDWWSMAYTKTPSREIQSRTSSPPEHLSAETVLDALKMILFGAPLNSVLESVTKLIESNTEGMLCTIFLLDANGQHMHYAAAPNLPETYRATTDELR